MSQQNMCKQEPNKFFNELDLRFVNRVIKTSLDTMKTRVSTSNLIDPLAKLVFSLAVKAVSERGMFCPEIDLQILVNDEDRLDKFKAFNHPYTITTVQDLIMYINTFTTEAATSSMENSILERFTRNAMTKLNNKLMVDLTDSTKTTKELLRSYTYSLDTLSMASASTRKIISAEQAVQQEIDYINSPVADAFPTTGIPPIDYVNTGVNAPSVTILAGESKSGKSSLLYNIAVDSLKQGRVVLFGTIEIPSEEAMRKLICCYFGIDYNTVNKKLYESEDEKQEYTELVRRFAKETEDKLIVFDDDDGMCCKDLEVQCSILKKAGIDVQDIIIDYTLLLKSNNPKYVGNEALSYIPAELRQLSKRTNTRVFSAAQLHTRDKDIEDITTEDIYYMKNLSHEITYLLFLKNRKTIYKGVEKTDFFMKFAPSRQLWDSRLYSFPNIDFDRLYVGDFDIVTSTKQMQNVAEAPDYDVEDSMSYGVSKKNSYDWL